MSYIERFKCIAASFPGREAVVYDGRRYTYGEWDRATDLAANALRRSIGEGPGRTVVIYLSSPHNILFSIFCILKVGGVFCVLDKSRPLDQVQAIYEGLSSAPIISDGPLPFAPIIEVDKLFHCENAEPVRESFAGQRDSYLVFTSGTTGFPKGTVIRDESLLNYCNWIIRRCSLSEQDSSLLVSSLSFDLGFTGVFPILLSGGTLHLMDKDKYMTPSYVLRYIAENSISFLKTTPTFFNIICSSPAYETCMKSVRNYLFGGERINAKDVCKLKAAYPAMHVFNHYGPCECTIGSLMYLVPDSVPDDDIPIGTPVDNCSVFVRTDSGVLTQDPDVNGEIVISGVNVSAGYVYVGKKVKDSFFMLEGRHAYRTGDAGHFDRDGMLHIAGRQDRQIKYKGYRVELEEIEKQMVSHLPVSSSAVIFIEDAIVAFYKPNDGTAAPSDVQLRHELGRYLPGYMIPKYFIALEDLPSTPNGKVDFEYLKSYYLDAASSFREVSSSKETEDKCDEVLRIWRRFVPAPTRECEDFFALGGDSLSFFSMLVQLGKQFEKDLPYFRYVKTPLFSHLKTSILEDAVQDRDGASAGDSHQHDRYPLLPVQRFQLLDEMAHCFTVIEWERDFPGSGLDIEDRLNALARKQPMMCVKLSADWSALERDGSAIRVERYDCTDERSLTETVKKLLRPFDFMNERLFRYAVMTVFTGQRYLIIVKSHLVADNVLHLLPLLKVGSPHDAESNLLEYEQLVPVLDSPVLKRHLEECMQAIGTFQECFSPQTAGKGTSRVAFTMKTDGDRKNTIGFLSFVIGTQVCALMQLLDLSELPIAVYYHGRQYETVKETFYGAVSDFHDVYFLLLRRKGSLREYQDTVEEQLRLVGYGRYSGIRPVLSLLEERPSFRSCFKHGTAPLVINVLLAGDNHVAGKEGKSDESLLRAINNAKTSSVRYLSLLIRVSSDLRSVQGSLKENTYFTERLSRYQFRIDELQKERENTLATGRPD